MDYESIFGSDDADGNDDSGTTLFNLLHPMTEATESTRIPAEDVRKFMQSGLPNFTRELGDVESAETADGLGGGLRRKQRKKVDGVCEKCGASGIVLKNWGGATRETINSSAKYKMECQADLGGCGRPLGSAFPVDTVAFVGSA